MTKNHDWRTFGGEHELHDPFSTNPEKWCEKCAPVRIVELLEKVEREAVAKVVDEEGVMFENGKTFGRGEMLEEVKEVIEKMKAKAYANDFVFEAKIENDVLKEIEKLKEQTHG